MQRKIPYNNVKVKLMFASRFHPFTTQQQNNLFKRRIHSVFSVEKIQLSRSFMSVISFVVLKLIQSNLNLEGNQNVM